MKSLTSFICEGKREIVSYIKYYLSDVKDKDFLKRFADENLNGDDIESIKSYLIYDLDEKSVNKIVTPEFLYSTFGPLVQKRMSKLNAGDKEKNEVIDLFYNWFIKYAKGNNDPAQVIDDYRYDRELSGVSKAGITEFKKAVKAAQELIDDDEIESLLKDFEHLGDYAKNGKDAIEYVKRYFNK